MSDSHFDRFNARLQGIDNNPTFSRDFNADADLDAVLLRLNQVQDMGGLYAHVQLSSYTQARMGFKPASDYTGEAQVEELEAVSV